MTFGFKRSGRRPHQMRTLGRAFGNEMLVKFPRAVRCLGIIRPLLVYVGAGIGEHPVVKFQDDTKP